MPAVITPGGPLVKDGKTLTDFTSDIDVTWAASGGTLSGILARSVTWEAPNKTGVWTVSGGGDTVSITVRAIIPNFWNFRNPMHITKPVLIFEPIDGPAQTRGFGDGAMRHAWELSNDDSSYENYLEIREFWDYHHPHLPFDMIDPMVPERRTYKTDSDFDPTYVHGDSCQWAFRIKEAWPYAAV